VLSVNLNRRTYTAALLLIGVLTAPSAVQAKPAPAANDSAADLSAIRIDNFGRINANYYRGAQPAGRDYEALAALGIRTVVDLTSDDTDAAEPASARRAGLAYFQLRMTTHEPPSSTTIDQFLKIVNDPANQPVYVHCVGGRHRTGVMTAVYRMTQEGWSADQAFQEMKRFKFGADFLHPEFKTFVYSYHPEAASAPPAKANVERAPAR
jgi:tyrosine-protein phosphatase SIW14